MGVMHALGWGAAMRRLAAWGRNGVGERCLELERDGTWAAEIGRGGTEVRCTEGVVLVTCEGDPEDHVLSAGSVFVARRPGRLAVWALAPARVRVAVASPAALARPGCAPLGRRRTPARLAP
jgi:hypothetical protein